MTSSNTFFDITRDPIVHAGFKNHAANSFNSKISAAFGMVYLVLGVCCLVFEILYLVFGMWRKPGN